VVKVFILSLSALTLLTGCGTVLVAAGAGAVGGYIFGKNYTVKVEKR